MFKDFDVDRLPVQDSRVNLLDRFPTLHDALLGGTNDTFLRVKTVGLLVDTKIIHLPRVHVAKGPFLIRHQVWSIRVLASAELPGAMTLLGTPYYPVGIRVSYAPSRLELCLIRRLVKAGLCFLLLSLLAPDPDGLWFGVVTECLCRALGAVSILMLAGEGFGKVVVVLVGVRAMVPRTGQCSGRPSVCPGRLTA